MITKIAGSVVGSVLFFALLIGIGIVVYRRRQLNGKSYQQPVSKDNLAPAVQERQVCAICLDVGLNVRLPCMHRFHENCIKDWLKKNQLCPLCRNNYQASDVKSSLIAE